MKITLKNTRLSFPHLWKATQVMGEGKPTFAASFIIEPDNPALEIVQQAIEAAATEKWGAKAKAVLASLQAQDKVCLHSGNIKAEYDGYADNFYVSARSAARPLVIDRDKSPLSEESGRPYGGCFVNASLEIYAQDNAFGKRINASLRGVQFLRDGDAFAGGSPAVPDEFDDESTAEDELA